MRMIAYSEKFPLPFIDDIPKFDQRLKIVGGEWLDNGTRIALHCKYNKSGVREMAQDYVVIIPVGRLPRTLDDAMDDRQRELDRGRNLFREIVAPYQKAEQEG